MARKQYDPYSWSLKCPVCGKARKFTPEEYAAHCFALRWFTRRERLEPRFVVMAMHDLSCVIAHAEWSHEDGTTTGLIWVRCCEDCVPHYKPVPKPYGEQPAP